MGDDRDAVVEPEPEDTDMLKLGHHLMLVV